MKGNMTIVVVILIGAGALLLLSGINGTSLVDEFQGILQGSLAGTPTQLPGEHKVINPTDPGKITPHCPQGQVFNLPSGMTSCPSGYHVANEGGVQVCVCDMFGR